MLNISTAVNPKDVLYSPWELEVGDNLHFPPYRRRFQGHNWFEEYKKHTIGWSTISTLPPYYVARSHAPALSALLGVGSGTVAQAIAIGARDGGVKEPVINSYDDESNNREGITEWLRQVFVDMWVSYNLSATGPDKYEKLPIGHIDLFYVAVEWQHLMDKTLPTLSPRGIIITPKSQASIHFDPSGYYDLQEFQGHHVFSPPRQWIKPGDFWS